MNFRKTLIAAAVALATAQPALAQSSKEIEELRAEIRALRAELEQMKKEREKEKAATTPAAAAAAPAAAATAAAAPSNLAERVEQLEIKSKDAVVAGDNPGSFRLPGSETSIRIYGYAEAHAIHDLRKPGQSDFFTDLTFQPLDNDASIPKGKTKFTASTSRFGIETVTPTSAGSFNAKVEADFYSYGSSTRNRLRLRHAYGEYAGFLVGQTWSTFMDVDDIPETVDFNGPIGNPFSRRAMIRYTYADPKAGYKLTAALEDPEDQFGGGSASERLPQVVLRFDKSFEGGSFNVRLLGHEKRSATHTKRGYGFGLGGNYKLTDKALLMAQYTRVDGDIDQLYGSNGYAIDPNTGIITFDKNWGFVGGLAYTFSERLRGTLVYGTNRGDSAQAVDNKSLNQYHVNLIYSPLKNIELGGEYIYGQRKTFASDKGTLSRFDLMGRYSF